MRFSTKCWSEHILSAYKATKDLKHPLYMTFNKKQDENNSILISFKFKFFNFFAYLMNVPISSRALVCSVKNTDKNNVGIPMSAVRKDSACASKYTLK